MSLSNPLNIALLPPILYLVYRLVFPAFPSAAAASAKALPTAQDAAESGYNWAPARHPEAVCYRQFRPAELALSDGVKTPRILLAIARVRPDGSVIGRTVFDVTKGSNFYGPEGMYGNFAGRDASRGMAKQSFDEEMLTPLDQPLDTLADLTPAEIENMHGWHGHFSGKYIVCGELLEPEP